MGTMILKMNIWLLGGLHFMRIRLQYVGGFKKNVYYYKCTSMVFNMLSYFVRMMFGVSSIVPNINTERVKGIL